MKRKIIISAASASVALLLSTVSVFAHVIVTPNTVGIGKTQNFSMAVPNEKDTPITAVKLMIPNGVKEVMPNVQAGWTVTPVKNGDNVTEIDWTGGNIPPHQRVDLLFSAQVPATETTLKWSAIQTYQDGSTIEWTHDPTSNPEDDSAPPPYSKTMVVNDLKTTAVSAADSNNKNLLYVSWGAVILGGSALLLSLRNSMAKK